MKTLEGKVTSTKMEKTVVVIVERRWRHPLYKKIIKRNKKYLAHDDLGVSIGDTVIIAETKPISKRKKWKIVENANATEPKRVKDTKKKSNNK